METTRRNKKKLGIKLLIGLSLLAILVTAASIVVGSEIYKKNTTERYNDFAYRISDLAANTFTIDEIKYYSDKIKEYKAGGNVTLDDLRALADTDRYKEEQDRLERIRIQTQVNDVLIFYMDPDDLINYNSDESELLEYMPMGYIWDSYYKADECAKIGESWVVLDEYAAGIETALRTGNCYDGIITNEGSFGYTVTTIRPIYVDGESIACVMVELPMTQLMEDIREFQMAVSVTAAVTAIILLAIISLITMRTMIAPIVLVATEADSFISSDNTVSEKLATIKTNDEIQTLSESILAMEIGINEYIDNLTQAMEERQRISTELSVAKQIQAASLPSVFPPFPERNEFDLYATMKPAKEVGGDFYDFYLIDDDHLALEIADVSGKGVPAALFMMVSKILLKSQAMYTPSPAEVLAAVNNRLCENNRAEMFVTVWLGILEISTGKLVAANAGHEYPCVKRNNGKFEALKDTHGFVLAGLEDVEYSQYEVNLQPGDTLFVYTDGVAEATNSNDVLFGLDRTIDALNIEPEATPEKLIANVQKEIDNFVLDAPQFDDITMLCFHYR